MAASARSLRRARQRDAALASLHAGLGAWLLAAPERALRSCRTAPTPALRRGVRVLGARHLAEAALILAAGEPALPRMISRIDLAHALSMLPLAVVSRRLRAAALLSAGISSLLVALELGG